MTEHRLAKSHKTAHPDHPGNAGHARPFSGERFPRGGARDWQGTDPDPVTGSYKSYWGQTDDRFLYSPREDYS